MHDVPDPRRQRRWQLGALAVLLVMVSAIAGAVGGGGRSPVLRPGSPVPHAAQVQSLFAGVAQSGESLGSAGAPVTMIEFADLQCPFCAAFARTTLPDLVRREVRTGRLRLQLRPLAFLGSDSLRAARMALAVGRQNHLWEFVDLFYANQRDENSGYVSDAFLSVLAGAVAGVDVAAALVERGGPAVAAQLAASRSLAAQQHVPSTPAFLLGRTGRQLQAFRPDDLGIERFATAIDRIAARG